MEIYKNIELPKRYKKSSFTSRKIILKKGDVFTIKHSDGKKVTEKISKIIGDKHTFLICDSCAVYSECEIKTAIKLNR